MPRKTTKKAASRSRAKTKLVRTYAAMRRTMGHNRKGGVANTAARRRFAKASRMHERMGLTDLSYKAMRARLLHGRKVKHKRVPASKMAAQKKVKPKARSNPPGNLKITAAHYKTLKAAIGRVVTKHSQRKTWGGSMRGWLNFYKGKRLTEKRARWDLLWAATRSTLPANFVIDKLYPYMNDDHIDSALRAIVVELRGRHLRSKRHARSLARLKGTKTNPRSKFYQCYIRDTRRGVYAVKAWNCHASSVAEARRKCAKAHGVTLLRDKGAKGLDRDDRTVEVIAVHIPAAR